MRLELLLLYLLAGLIIENWANPALYNGSMSVYGKIRIVLVWPLFLTLLLAAFVVELVRHKA